MLHTHCGGGHTLGRDCDVQHPPQVLGELVQVVNGVDVGEGLVLYKRVEMGCGTVGECFIMKWHGVGLWRRAHARLRRRGGRGVRCGLSFGEVKYRNREGARGRGLFEPSCSPVGARRRRARGGRARVGGRRRRLGEWGWRGSTLLFGRLPRGIFGFYTQGLRNCFYRGLYRGFAKNENAILKFANFFFPWFHFTELGSFCARSDVCCRASLRTWCHFFFLVEVVVLIDVLVNFG